ncbi:unnamed protein product [Effrenium voratum]|nr:unnamed protein product [Effrenium voratum]
MQIMMQSGLDGCMQGAEQSGLGNLGQLLMQAVFEEPPQQEGPLDEAGPACPGDRYADCDGLCRGCDGNGYADCDGTVPGFTAAVAGAITYAVERTAVTGSTSLMPLMSTNLQEGEAWKSGVDTEFPICRLFVDVVLGVICGVAGGVWVRSHAYTAGVLKRWRLREAFAAPTVVAENEEPLLGQQRVGCLGRLKRCLVKLLGGSWRDLALVATVTTINTLFAAALPLMGSKPQPLLISTAFDKNLMLNDTEEWVLPWAGVNGTIFLCFLMKWTMTIIALSSAIPAGVVAPAMVIGGLLGRVYGHILIPEWVVAKGAFFARCAIIGASAFCAAVCRAFAMAITVFEVLALPNSVLPLCSSTLAAIFVANRISLPFFDANLATRNLGGIPAITFSDKAIEPVMKVMEVADMGEVLPTRAAQRSPAGSKIGFLLEW